MTQPTQIGIIYCRVSSKDQVDGTSLDSQKRLCLEWAEKQDIKIVKIFIEEGESAKSIDRTEFQKALTFCTDKRNKVNFFIVWKLDRFSRNQEDHIMVRALLKRSVVNLRSVTEPIDETSMGRAMEGMLSVFAELDNNIRRDRSKQGMLERVKQGIWVWPEPIGYKRIAQKDNISPDPDKSHFIVMAFEEWSKGTYTYAALADYLSERGFRTKMGVKPRAQLIQKILRNPIYCAIIDVDGWGTFEGKFEPIVSSELFAKCQPGYQNQSTHAAARSANNPLYPLRKVVVCSECGGSYTGSKAKGKYPYYHHHKQNCPKAKFIPKETFEQLFVEYLDEITPNERYEKLFKEVILDIWKNNYKNLDDQNAQTRKEIAALEQDRQRVFDFHRTGKYTDDDFNDQRKLINDRINEKRMLIQEKAVEEFDMEEALDYCFNFVRNTAKTWLELEQNYPARLRFQKKVIVGNIEFDGQKFGTAKLSSIYQLNQDLSKRKKTSSQSSSFLAAPRGIEPRLRG